MKLIVIISLILLQNECLGQKYMQDSLTSLFKENTELRKQVQDFKEEVNKNKEQLVALEKIQNHWLAAMGIIGTLILLAFVGNIWNSYRVIKKEGQEARNEIKQDYDTFKNELKTAKEDIENTHEQLKTLTLSMMQTTTNQNNNESNI